MLIKNRMANTDSTERRTATGLQDWSYSRTHLNLCLLLLLYGDSASALNGLVAFVSLERR